MGRLDRRLTWRQALRLYVAVTAAAGVPLVLFGLLVDGSL